MSVIFFWNRRVDCESTHNEMTAYLELEFCPALKLCSWQWPQVFRRMWSLSHAWQGTKGHYVANGFCFGIPCSASYWNAKAYTMQMAYFINTNRSPGNRCFGDWGKRSSLYFSNSNNSDDKFSPTEHIEPRAKKHVVFKPWAFNGI